MDLSYDWGFGTNQLNGSIAGNKWRSKGDGQQRAYGFGYDDLNRLLFADFNQYSGSGWDKTAGVDFTSIMGNGADPNTAYDQNGNIKAMQQTAWQLGGSHLIDSLNYTYYNNSNKLQNVIDGHNNPQTTLGDFRTSSLSPYASGKTSTAIDYTYDGNGNLLTDLNKDIGNQSTNGIIYNHLNLPWLVSVRSATGTKGTITYIYDATGDKLKKTTLDSAGNLQTVTTYIGPFQYQGTQSLTSGITPTDTLKFFGHEEGRVRVESDTTGGQSITSYKYDYFLKDHLGNTRMVLTDEAQTDMYPAATMEVADSVTQNLYYMGLDSTRSALPPGYPTDTTTNPNNYVAKLSVNDNTPVIGPGIVMKVMAGDEFSIRVSSWYRLNGTTPGTPVNPLTDLLASLISGISGVPNPEAPGLSVLQANTPTLSSNVLKFLQDTGTTIINTKPHAFVNWILLDNQFNYIASSSGFSQVGNDQQLQKTVLTNLPITSSGYLYIYTSNETPNVDVFFDNLQVTHTRGPLLEEDHYFPFGLTMAGISDKALKSQYVENKYRYNKGSELQNKEFSDGTGLELYETSLRSLDPQLGRWWQIDSKPTEAESPYSAMGNNPILRDDPLGDSAPSPIERIKAEHPELFRKESTDGDQTGLITNSTSEDRAKHPIISGVRDFLVGLADVTGLNAVDNISANVRKANDNGTLDMVNGTQAALSIAFVSPGEGGEEPVQPYEVGISSELKARSIGDNLDIHHVPQGQPASQLIEGYDYKNAPAIALPPGEHQSIPNEKGVATASSARQQLARNVRQLRATTNAPNSSLEKLIKLNKQLYPENILKRPK